MALAILNEGYSCHQLFGNYKFWNTNTMKKKPFAFQRGVIKKPTVNSSWELLKLGDNNEHQYFFHAVL